MNEAMRISERHGLFALLLSVSIISRGMATAAPDSLVLIQGDVTLAAIFGTNKVKEGRECGAYDVNSLQEIVAVTWFLNAVNTMNYINNVTIGLEVVRTCKMPEKANYDVIELLSRYEVGQGNFNTSNNMLFGVIGADRTAEAASVSKLLGSLPSIQQLVQISGSATGRQLSNRTLHPNFFRVVPSDAVQVQVIVDLLQRLQWNYVAIVYADDDYGREAAFQLRHLAEGKGICVPVFASLPLDVATSKFTEQSRNIVEQMSSQENGMVRGMVVLGDETFTQQLARRLQEQATFVQLVVSDAVGLQITNLLTIERQSVLAGALVTAPPDLYLPGFTPFWNGIWTNKSQFDLLVERNVWLRGYFTQITGCESYSSCWDDEANVRNSQTISEGESSWRELSHYIGYDVKATAVMVQLLKLLHSKNCRSPGLCPQLRKVISDRLEVQEVLQKETFSFAGFASISPTLANFSTVTFDANGDIVDPGMNDEYNVYNLRRSGPNDFSFQKVGSFSSGRLFINTTETEFYDEAGSSLTWEELPPAQCAADHDCLQCERDTSKDVIFMEGDFYIISVAPVHVKSPSDLLSCGAVKGQVGADLAQAVVFAVNTVNEKEGEFRNVLPNRTVGLVGISSCGSSLVVKQRLIDFFSGRLQLPNGHNSSTLVDSVMGIVGAAWSSNSIAASDVLTTLGRTFVQVSPASTSVALKDRARHPYFMRLVPADDRQVQAMLDVVQGLGANYIQVIYDSSTAYATDFYNKLREESSSGKYKVCVAQSIPTTPHPDTSQYKYIVDVLRDESAARIVIVVLHPTQIDKVLEAILPLLTPDDDFLFLGSESWGRTQYLINGRAKLEGSLVLAQEIAVDKDFEKYFNSLDPVASNNPWLRYFWEAQAHCYLDQSFRREGKEKSCSDDFRDEYEQDVRAPLYIQTAYALVKGFDAALKQYCGSRATTICDSLDSAKLVSAMKNVQLALYDDKVYSSVFDDNGDGLVGYKILKVSRDLAASGDVLVYQDVGQWTTEGVTLQVDQVRKVSSVCPNDLKCDRCFSPNGTGAEQDGSTSASKDIPGLPLRSVAGLGATLGVIIIILIVIVVYLARRLRSYRDPVLQAQSALGDKTRSGKRQSNQYVGSDEGYVTPAEILSNEQYWERQAAPPPPCGFRHSQDDGYLTAASAQGAVTSKDVLP